MIQRSRTSTTQIFNRPFPEAVTYDLSQPNCVTITLPPGSSWTSGLHWHEKHTEYLQVLSGCAWVSLGGVGYACNPADGVIEVKKGVVHEWRRVSEGYAVSELVVKEWTVPEDGQKEVFFRMLNSFLMEERPNALYEAPTMIPRWMRARIERWIVVLQLFTIFRDLDNWPVLVGSGSGVSSWIVTHLTLTTCSYFGYLLGLRGVYKDYVGENLVSRAMKIVQQAPTIKSQ